MDWPPQGERAPPAQHRRTASRRRSPLSVTPGHPLGYQDAFTAFAADTYAAISGAAPDGLPVFAEKWGYDGLKIACSGEHLDVQRAVDDDAYLQARLDILKRHNLQLFAISHLAWGDPKRGWYFVSTGHGDVPWADSFGARKAIGYNGPISIEWEDAGMSRLHGAAEAVQFVRSLLWDLPEQSFDAAFSNQD